MDQLIRSYALRVDGMLRVIDYTPACPSGIDISDRYENAAEGFSRIEASLDIYVGEGATVHSSYSNPLDSDSLASLALLEAVYMRDRERGDFAGR